MSTTFGRRLAHRRKEQGLTQMEFAERLGTSYSLIGRYERGKVRPSIDTVSRLAAELGTTAGYLLGENEHDELLADPAFLGRLDGIRQMDEEDRGILFRVMDALIRDSQARKTYGK